MNNFQVLWRFTDEFSKLTAYFVLENFQIFRKQSFMITLNVKDQASEISHSFSNVSERTVSRDFRKFDKFPKLTKYFQNFPSKYSIENVKTIFCNLV